LIAAEKIRPRFIQTSSVLFRGWFDVSFALRESFSQLSWFIKSKIDARFLLLSALAYS